MVGGVDTYVHCLRNVCVKVDVDRPAFGLQFLLAVALLSHSLWKERPEADCVLPWYSQHKYHSLGEILA